MARSIQTPGQPVGGFTEDGEEWPEVERTFYLPDGSKFIPQRGDSVDLDHSKRAYILHRNGQDYELSPGKPAPPPLATRPKKVRVLK